jgi:hypothetical protein
LSKKTLFSRPPITARLQCDKIFSLALWIGTVVVGSYHLCLELLTVTLPEPMGFWETAYAARARIWPNQYQFGHYINGHDGYGPGYLAFVRPFLWTGLDVYAAHRIANLVAILLTCALLMRLLRHHCCPLAIAAALTVILYSLNAGSYSIQARPDFLVLFAITAMLTLGDAVARGRLKLSATFGVYFGLVCLAAFLTKAYAAIIAAMILASLALIIDRRKGLYVSILCGAIVATGTWLYALNNPFYVMEVFDGPRVQAAPSFAWLHYQVTDFATLTSGLLFAAGVLAVNKMWFSKDESKKCLVLNGELSHKYWFLQCALGTLLLLAGPAWHTGAYLTYFFHLLLVPLIGFAGALIRMASPGFRRWSQFALLTNLVVLMITAPSWPRDDKSWQALRRDALDEQGRVGVDYIMEPIAREKPGAVLFGTGMTGYALQEPLLLRQNTPILQRARREAEAYRDALSNDVFGKQPLDVIYLDCLLQRSPNAPAHFALVPRNGIPIFTGPEMSNFVVKATYTITPYYFATNLHRQNAGLATVTIVKFVRKKHGL